MRRVFGLFLVLALLAVPARAQQFVRLQATSTTDTISSSGDSLTLTNANVGGFGTVKVQTLDSYSGTWEAQCSLDGTTFDTDNELGLKLLDSTSTVFSVTDEIGIWDITNGSACRAIKVIATNGFAASDTVVVISAIQSGGSGGGGAESAAYDSTADALKALLVDASGNALTLAEDAVIGDPAPSGGPQVTCRYVVLDSAALPVQADVEGDSTTCVTGPDGVLVTRFRDPCSGVKTFVPIDIVTATTVELANAVASEFFYICSIDLHTNAANNVVIAEDDTDGCGSITAGVTGGVTAAEGYNFGANGGRTVGNGLGSIAKTTTAARYLCILTSAATQLSGSIGFVSAP